MRATRRPGSRRTVPPHQPDGHLARGNGAAPAPPVAQEGASAASRGAQTGTSAASSLIGLTPTPRPCPGRAPAVDAPALTVEAPLSTKVIPPPGPEPAPPTSNQARLDPAGPRPSGAPELRKRDLRLGVPDDPVLALRRLHVHHRGAVGHRAHASAHHDLLLREAHTAELNRETSHSPRIATGDGLYGARHLRHAVKPVKDVRRQADRRRELLVDVDRVEVARGAGVAVREVLVRRHPQLFDLVALVHSAHLTMLVHVPRTTSWPSWLRDTDSKT